MKKRKMKGKSSEEGVDRISDISDEVLSHILSFLPTKEAVGTCLLSKRWRHVWEMVPALDIKPESTLEYHTNLKTFLRLRRTKMITRLHLECDIHSSPFNFNFLISKPRRHSDCSNYIQEWVEEAVAGEVEQVNLSLKACQRCHEKDDEVSFSLPISLLTCTTIVTMKIEGLFILHVPSCIELLSLKSLHLNVQKCKPSCGKFLSGSPALEAFYLKERDLEIERNSQSNRIISNKRSHRLVIESDPGYDYVQDYLKGHLKNVVKAKVFIELHKVSSKKFPILKAIRNVEYLCLSDWNQSNSYLDVQQFPNLLHLELDLKSEGTFILPVLSSVQLPSPKSLDVEVQKCKRVSCKEFLSRSPALKVFYLKQKCGDGFEELKIERNSHTNLIVSNNPLLNLVIQSDGGYDYVQDYFEGQLENVVKAKVSMTLNAESSKSKVYEVYSHGFSVLKAIRNVEFLSLRDKNGSMDGVSLVDGVSSFDLPKLPNLVQLQLHIIHHYSSLFLKLISSDYCPKLEVYGVNHMHWKYCKQQKKWINMTTYGMQPHHSGNLSWGCKTMRLPSDFGSGQDG